MPAVHVDRVSFTYAGSTRETLHNLSLDIAAGEFLLLAGPSGCGKSTLALALAGLIPSRISGDFHGHVYLDTRDIGTMEVHEAAQHIGIVFQNPDEQLVHLDVESEVAFGPENLALPRSEIASRVSQALDRTNMQTARDLEIFVLSGGQKQRVAIAATLAMQSHILILDEPTSDLDPVGTQEVLAVLKNLNKQHGWTIILVEHKIDEVIPWVDRVILMDEGNIIVDAPTRQAFSELAPWQRLRVAVPQMVELAHLLPDAFSGLLPLSVDDAYSALLASRYKETIQRQTTQLQQPSTSPSTPSPLLSWHNVTLKYDERTVLDSVNLSVGTQEWLALIGANGAGKTSLASLAMGFQAPTAGTIDFMGKPIAAGKISRQAASMAYLFQAADKMLFAATVEKELLFGVKHQRKNKNTQPAIPHEIDHLLEVIDLVGDRDTNPFYLSHGQRKRLAIGALLARDPRILILDEPTTGQDEGHARDFLQFLEKLRIDAHLTYLMITHNMEAVARYANRVVVLKDAHIVMNGAPEYVFSHTDELLACGILPPSLAQLQTRLYQGHAQKVLLNVSTFAQSLVSLEALS